MADFPYFPFWVADYIADTHDITQDEHGAYLLLLMAAWRTDDCALPNDDKLLARYAHASKVIWKRQRKTVLHRFFKLGDDGRWRQKRLTKEREKAQRLSETNSRNVKNRWLKTKETGDTTVIRNAYENDTNHTYTHTHTHKDESPSVCPPLIPDDPQPAALDAPAKPSPKRKHQLPDDFDLTPERTAAAKRHGINGEVRDVFEHFCAHHRAKGTTMLRWDLAWITWLKNQKRFGHGPPQYKQRKSKAEECAELMEMWRLEDERKNEGRFETELNGLPSNVSILRPKA